MYVCVVTAIAVCLDDDAQFFKQSYYLKIMTWKEREPNTGPHKTC
jgi:hypothetical protein